MSHSAWSFRAANERWSSLSLSESLSLTLFFTVRRESSVVSFSQKGWRKREKKKSQSAKNFRLKNNTTKKSERVFNNNNKKKKNSLQNFSSFFSCEKERKKDAFSSGELPESGMYSSYITTHTERERDLSFFLSLFFFRSSFVFVFCVLLLSSRLVFAFVFVRELNRENGIGNGAAHALAHSLSETTNRWCVYYVCY